MRKELCRNFQRGSCRYGENCRFLHPQQQQQAKPNNPFGFGTQQQQEQQNTSNSNNPFGFGVQGASSNGTNQFKPFDNKWQRTPSTPPTTTTQQTSSKQTQQPAVDHKCTDPGACKRIMQEDFKNERPMWKLTCYGHWKHLPCDITGDISFEELRAMAYEEAKRGVPFQSIVERERNMQNSKIAEFDKFLRNPSIVTTNQSPFGTASQINSTPAPVFSGFNQQPSFPNTIPSPNNNPFASFGQQPNAFSVNTPQPVNSVPSGFQAQPTIVAFKPASFGPGPGLATPPQNNNMFATPSLNTFQNSQSPFGVASQINLPPAPAPAPAPVPAFSAFNQQPSFPNTIPVASFTAPVIDTANTSSGTEAKIESAPVDSSIWLKEKWNPGEIPEQAPPDAFV